MHDNTQTDNKDGVFEFIDVDMDEFAPPEDADT